jgi:Protein of unknown function (DUF3093)
MMNLSFALALWAAFDTQTAIVDFLITLALFLFLAQKTPLRISVDQDWLFVGKAKIETKYISSIKVLGKSEIALLRTGQANTDAYLDLRFWVPVGIKVEIDDARDYTPYWLISTKRGVEIKKILQK